MKLAMIFSVFAAFLLLPITSMAADPEAWSCRNTDMEVSCAKGACLAEMTGFTPMGVVISMQKLSVCAYTGCWESRPVMVSDGNLIYVHSQNMKWSHEGQKSSADFQIALNRKSQTAVLLGEGYAHPMHCKAVDAP